MELFQSASVLTLRTPKNIQHIAHAVAESRYYFLCQAAATTDRAYTDRHECTDAHLLQSRGHSGTHSALRQHHRYTVHWHHTDRLHHYSLLAPEGCIHIHFLHTSINTSPHTQRVHVSTHKLNHKKVNTGRVTRLSSVPAHSSATWGRGMLISFSKVSTLEPAVGTYLVLWTVTRLFHFGRHAIQVTITIT